jgi:hypothetical protein
MKPKIRIEQKAWAVLSYESPSGTLLLNGFKINPYIDDRIRDAVMKFKNRGAAREFCREHAGWAFRPVRIREVVEVI